MEILWPTLTVFGKSINGEIQNRVAAPLCAYKGSQIL